MASSGTEEKEAPLKVDEALLKWVNTCFKGLPFEAKKLADLSDGKIFLKILERLDPIYASIDLEEITPSSKWLAKKKNLEAIYKSLVRYMNNHCQFPPFALREPVDVNSIAEHNDVQQTIKLLSLFLMAAINSPEYEKYIVEIQALGEKAGTKIAQVITAMQGGEESSKSKDTHDSRLRPNISNDLELAAEEEFAKLTKQHERLQKKYADSLTTIERLSMNIEEINEKILEQQLELNQMAGTNNESQTNYIQNLKGRISEQEELIARQENQIEENRIVRERHVKELSTLRPHVQIVQQLEDEVKELKTQNSALTKKANKVDHYEKKLERASYLEKEILRLRTQNETLQSNQITFDRVHELNDRLEAETVSYRKKMEQYELDLSEHRERKLHLDQELRARDLMIESLRAKQAHDEQFIEDLQEQVKSGTDIPHSPDSPTALNAGLTLGAELEQSEGHQTNYPLEISRLKAENQLLKSNTAGTSNANLRVDLEEAERLRKRLESQIQELTEKYAVGQEQINAILSEETGQKNEVIANTRRLWLEATRELTATKAKLADLQLELTERDRQILTAKADLNAVDKGEIEALDELRLANETIVASLQNDLLLLQGQLKTLTADFEQQKNQLIDALLAKDKALHELDSLREVMINNGEGQRAEIQAGEKLQEKKVQTDLKEQINIQELTIQDLQQQLKVATESSPDAQKAKNEAIIKNLMRENTLITTAWYDLTNRLQSNNVVLQRRQDAPKSWLNQQRQMVNAKPRR